ncbi:alpha/beta hydrolase [Mycobacterium manitobense]|uniref:Alpha/beta hydrolase n=1 Tax=[Mycobacterium] manitobense TaxID=190147 RepID=A0A9X2YS35_9MYCO|nr:alpha/beta hydrolase [[Mycobacterium] manitobense]MCV7173158.1 alpha/beta hydrolase [[Mycobacterium] manitobense]
MSTGFGTTHVIVSGPEAAPPLVLLHGAAATAVMWAPVIEALSADHRCHCVDTITEANKSVASRRARGVPDLTTWLTEVFAGLGIDSAMVAGLSYGGWLAANLAVREPKLIERMVLVCPAATLAPLPAEFYMRMFTSGLLRSPVRARRFVRWMSSTPEVMSHPTAELIVSNLLSARILRPEVTLPTVLTDDELRRIGAPTTVVIGDQEVIYRTGPRSALDRAEALIPDLRTVSIPGANHMLTVDAPSRLAAELRTALA